MTFDTGASHLPAPTLHYHFKTNQMKKLLTLLGAALLAIALHAQQNKKMKINVNDTAPDFIVTDVNNNNVTLSKFKGKRVLLTFYRNVGCPVCNLRFHELSHYDSFFKANNVVLIAVYESSSENMLTYLANEEVYPHMIPDSSQLLYALYDLERSTGKMLKSMFKGAMGKMKKGRKLFKTEIKQDGNANRIGAEFLIDENGIVSIAHYGSYIGDDLPIEQIITAITK